MDDIIIFSDNLDNQCKWTKLVLQRLQENNLFLKLEKCCFKATEVEYLGIIVSHNKLAMDSAKLAGIWDWPVPTNMKQVKSFLGFGNFYWWFISHYADIARPLNNLMNKLLTWNWSLACQEVFNNLKAQFTQTSTLIMPNVTKPFVVESDASKFATGAVLCQHHTDGDWHSCGYIFGFFDQTQWNYEIYNHKLLGIICALDTWRHYLHRSLHPVTILSNYKNLTYFRTAQCCGFGVNQSSN